MQILGATFKVAFFMLDHFLMRGFFKVVKPIFDPLFRADELPELLLFYPDNQWYNEQKMLRGFSQKPAVKIENYFSNKLILTMLFWECRPAKIVTISFIAMFCALIMVPFSDSNNAYGIFILSYCIFIIACTYHADNFFAVANYWLRSSQNKQKILKLLDNKNHFEDFITAYDEYRYLQKFVKENKYLNLAVSIAWLMLLIGLLALIIII